MAGVNDENARPEDLGELIGWLEDERTKDLVDLINRAALGRPVEEAAERYKARYRHSGSVDKLSDMFDSLQQQHDSNAAIRLSAITAQLRQCQAGLEKLQAEFVELQADCIDGCTAETERLAGLAAGLRDMDDLVRAFRERVVSTGSRDKEACEGRLRIIGL